MSQLASVIGIHIGGQTTLSIMLNIAETNYTRRLALALARAMVLHKSKYASRGPSPDQLEPGFGFICVAKSCALPLDRDCPR